MHYYIWKCFKVYFLFLLTDPLLSIAPPQEEICVSESKCCKPSQWHRLELSQTDLLITTWALCHLHLSQKNALKIISSFFCLSGQPFATCTFDASSQVSAACGVTTRPQGGWSLNSGPTPTSGTGPKGDHTSGSGKCPFFRIYLFYFHC